MRYKRVAGTAAFKVGTDGSVWSCNTHRKKLGNTWHRMKDSPMPVSGYLRVKIHGKTRYVHTLVLETFRGPRPTPQHECRHKNGKRSDNRLSNLAWGTKLENAADKIKHGTCSRLAGEANPVAKLNSAQVLSLVQEIQAGRSMYSLAKNGLVSIGTLQSIMAGRIWGTVTGIPLRGPLKALNGLEQKHSKLDAKKVQAIMQAVATGATYKSQALIYGVSTSTVQHIAKGLAWTCVTKMEPVTEDRRRLNHRGPRQTLEKAKPAGESEDPAGF